MTNVIKNLNMQKKLLIILLNELINHNYYKYYNYF